jgi:hypothetical protein
MMVETTFNEKFLRMLHGPGGGFFKKSPLDAGGKSDGEFRNLFFTFFSLNDSINFQYMLQ